MVFAVASLVAWALVGPVQGAGQGRVAEAAPPTPPPVTSTTPALRGLRKPGVFVNLSPGLLDMNLVVDGFELGYVWGVDGGYHFAFGRGFGLQAGGFFEHRPYRGNHRFRFGGITRIGGGNERVFGYGLIRFGPDIYDVNVDLCDECNRYPESPYAEPFVPYTRVGLLPGLGAGVLGMFHRLVGFGGELGYDFPDFEIENQVRIRLFLALKF